jgi:magnesium-transporting ATPase (P-type)
MSLLVKHVQTSRHYLMTKGADQVMIPRVKLDLATQNKMEQDLLKFALQGLRTLVFSRKELDDQELNEFMRKYTELKTSGDP